MSDDALTPEEAEVVAAIAESYRGTRLSPDTKRRCSVEIAATLRRMRAHDPWARPVPPVAVVCAGHDLRVTIGRGRGTVSQGYASASRTTGYTQEDGLYDWQNDGAARAGPPPDDLTRDEVVARLRKMADFERFRAERIDGRRSLLAGVKDDAEKNVAALEAAIVMLEGMDRD